MIDKMVTYSLCFILLSISVSVISLAEKPPYEISKGNNGLEKLTLRNHSTNTSIEVYLYGAHVTSWRNQQGKQLIFVSNKSYFESKKPIRGGIPICFPQFSNFGPLMSHGFARISLWAIDNSSAHPLPSSYSDKTFVDLILTSTKESIQLWPHKFEFRQRVILRDTGNLMLISRIKNIDDEPFNFTFALHTYFSVSNISHVRVEGLKGLGYLDNVKNRTHFTDKEEAITFKSELDRIYLNTPPNISILDHGKNRKFVVHKYNLSDAVVWNPWAEKAKNMTDFGANEYKKMVAVEAAAIEKPIIVNPNEEWTGILELSEMRAA